MNTRINATTKPPNTPEMIIPVLVRDEVCCSFASWAAKEAVGKTVTGRVVVTNSEAVV
jgi:hypothetical protein